MNIELRSELIRLVGVCLGVLCLGGVLASCSSTGYAMASHNGKYYYFPEKCEQYKYSYNDSDTLYCVHKGETTGQYLSPANRDDVVEYQRQQAESTARLNQSLQNLNKTFQKMEEDRPKTTNCMNLGYGHVSCTTY